MDRSELESLLTAHEGWSRGEPEGGRLVLRDADLRGLDLSGRNLDHAELTGVDLSGGNLRGAGFDSAKLTRVRFYRADISEASFSSAILEDVDFADAALGGAE